MQQAQQIAKMGSWEFDIVNNKSTWSENLYIIYGLIPYSIEPSNEYFRSNVHPEDLHLVDEGKERMIKNQEPIEIEIRYINPNGNTKWIQNKVVPYFINNEITLFKGVNIDITERKIAEEALRKSENQIRLLLNSTAEGIYGIDLDGNCTFVNDSCLRILGYEKSEDLIGVNMHYQIHSKYEDGTPYPDMECKIYKAYRLGEDIHVDDEVFWKADGTSFAAEYRSFPQKRNDEIIGAVVTFYDIQKGESLMNN